MRQLMQLATERGSSSFARGSAAPSALLAASLGIDPKTAMLHANKAGTDYLAYAVLKNATT